MERFLHYIENFSKSLGFNNIYKNNNINFGDIGMNIFKVQALTYCLVP